MRPSWICSLLVLCISAGASARVTRAQEVILEPVLGTIQIDNDAEYACQLSASQICVACVQDQDSPGSAPPLILSFGITGLSGWSFGTMSGTIALSAEIDGLVIPPALLPCDSFFTSRIGVGALFNPVSPCGAQGLDYQINANTGSFTGGGNHEITIPAEEAGAVAFEIDFCNVSAHWGSGCNVNGSVNDRWLLHAPGELSAADVGPGDATPLSFPTERATLDFQHSPGGTVTVLRSEADAPGGMAPAGPAGYWEVRTDMPDGTYSAVVTLEFDPMTLPAGTNPAGLMIARFDRVENGWESLTSVVDVPAGTVTASTGGLSKLVLTTEHVVGARSSSWGAVKAKF